MKPPYRSELEALPPTYVDSLALDVEPLRRAAQAVGCGPAAFVGSGGAKVLALLAARLHEWTCRQFASACTSLELLDLPQLDRRGAVLFSSSAKHPDARLVLDDFKRGRFGPTAVITHRTSDEVQALASPDTHVVSVAEPAQRDGFLATGSILQVSTLLFRAYLDTPVLPASIDAEYEEEAPLRDEVVVLSAPSLTCVAADLEVRLVESGVASVQVADFRNFAHGRHTGFARRKERTTVIVLSDAASQPLAEGTAAVMPVDTDVRRWHCDAAWETAVVRLLARSMRLAASAGERAGLDVARPTVPAFGRRLYRLPLRRRLPDRLAAGITRKLLASGSGDRSAAREAYAAAAAAWAEALAEQRFAGLVLDYDGTVCWTARRWELPDVSVRKALDDLLGKGMHVGFASGRGRSLHADLRRWVPQARWPQVVVGLYNGAVCLRLDDELPDLREPSAWSRSVAAAIGDMPGFLALEVEERGAQVSIGVADGVVHHGQLAPMLRDRLDAAGVDAQVVASGHSVDVIESSSSKVAVADSVMELAGGSVLAIGDQGQLGGNDHALLAWTDWTLTVDRCSADPTRCWFAGTGDRVGPALLTGYLKVLRKRRDGFAVSGMVVS